MCYLTVLEELSVLKVFFMLFLVHVSELKGVLSCKYFPEVGWYLQ